MVIKAKYCYFTTSTSLPAVSCEQWAVSHLLTPQREQFYLPLAPGGGAGGFYSVNIYQILLATDWGAFGYFDTVVIFTTYMILLWLKENEINPALLSHLRARVYLTSLKLWLFHLSLGSGWGILGFYIVNSGPGFRNYFLKCMCFTVNYPTGESHCSDPRFCKDSLHWMGFTYH